MGVTINCPEPRLHSFIVKVWSEEPETTTGRVGWRGHITHVPSGKRRYVQRLNEISIFIEGHLREMGVSLQVERGWWKWLKHLLVRMERGGPRS